MVKLLFVHDAQDLKELHRKQRIICSHMLRILFSVPP